MKIDPKHFEQIIADLQKVPMDPEEMGMSHEDGGSHAEMAPKGVSIHIKAEGMDPKAEGMDEELGDHEMSPSPSAKDLARTAPHEKRMMLMKKIHAMRNM